MTTTFINSSNDSVLLGTAGWGAKVSKNIAHEILKNYYANGYRWIDTATNYPLDGNPENFGRTMEWLRDFQQDFPEMKVFIKVGAATNLGGPTQLVNVSYLTIIFEILQDKFGGSLGGLGIHWDTGTDAADRSAIVDFFAHVYEEGHVVGLSGIAKPERYSENPIAKVLPWLYQLNLAPMRTNQLDTDLDLIRDNFPNAKIFGYNLLGGVSRKGFQEGENRFTALSRSLGLEQSSTKMEVFKRIVAKSSSLGIQGTLIGPTTPEQCAEWCELLERSQ